MQVVKFNKSNSKLLHIFTGHGVWLYDPDMYHMRRKVSWRQCPRQPEVPRRPLPLMRSRLVEERMKADVKRVVISYIMQCVC